MKDSSLGFIICISLSVLTVAVLFQRTQRKESFELDSSPLVFEKSTFGLGIAVSLILLAILFGGFFLFLYSNPKQPNVIAPRKGYFLNNQY